MKSNFNPKYFSDPTENTGSGNRSQDISVSDKPRMSSNAMREKSVQI
jgi:hypothetical protein